MASDDHRFMDGCGPKALGRKDIPDSHFGEPNSCTKCGQIVPPETTGHKCPPNKIMTTLGEEEIIQPIYTRGSGSVTWENRGDMMRQEARRLNYENQRRQREARAKMDTHYQQADRAIREVIEALQRILGQDGEDLSCYQPQMLDESISGLIAARSHMAVGTYKHINNPRH